MSIRDTLFRYATPLTTGLFVVSLVTGVALFFHVGTSWARGMHEILSMVLIVPFVLHLWRNWGTFLAYFRRSAMWIALALTVIAAMPFVVGGGEGGSDPRTVIFGALTQADVAAVAALAKTDEATVVARLAAAGFAEAKAGDTMADLAARNGGDAFDVVGAALAP